MARVDPTTLLFEDLTDEEATALTTLAERIMFGPGLTQTEPLFETWMEAGGFAGEQRLLVMATVFPARALLSIVRRTKRETLTFSSLARQGDVFVHNIGPTFVLVDFIPVERSGRSPKEGAKRHGEGIDLVTAIANLRVLNRS